MVVHPQILFQRNLEQGPYVAALGNASSKALVHRCIGADALASTHPWKVEVRIASSDFGSFVVGALQTGVDQPGKEP